MPTAKFLEDYKYYVGKNHLLTRAEKEVIWSMTTMDWGDGLPAHAYTPCSKEMSEAHDSLARFKTLACGHRMGKSVWATMDRLPQIVDPRGDVTGWVIGNEYSITDNEWHYLENAVFKTPLYDWICDRIQEQCEEKGLKERNPGKRIHHVNSPKKRLTIDWPASPKTVIEQKSYKDSSKWINLEGVKLAFLIVAEGSTLPKDLWDKHLDMRMVDKGGIVIFPATPKSMGGFMQTIFREGLKKRVKVEVNYTEGHVDWHYEDVEKSENHIDNASTFLESYESWQLPSFTADHFNQRAYTRAVKNVLNGKLPESFFRQNIFGEHTSHTGKVFSGIPTDIYITKEAHPIDPRATIFRCADIGFATPSCCLWVAIEPPKTGESFEQWVIFRELYKEGLWVGDRENHNPDTTFSGMILAMSPEPTEFTVVDRRSAHAKTSHAPKTIEQMMQEAGINVTTVSSMPNDTIIPVHRLKKMLLSRRILIIESECPNLCNELNTLEFSEKKYKAGRASQQNKVEDNTGMHAIDSLIYLIYKDPYWCRPNNEVEAERLQMLPGKNSFLEAIRENAPTPRNRNRIRSLGSH